ncbi:MAG: NAD-dependent epimerase/dehydratase family protein [Anaerolineales bacterium]
MMQNPLSADLIHILDHTRDLWEDLRGARLFITGGTGFFGKWLMESFLFANHQLHLKASASVLTRRPDIAQQALPHLYLDSAVTLIKGDVRNFEFPKGEYSHIIHAATEASAKLNNESPLLMLDTIVEGTRRTLDFAVYCKAQKFLLTSSGAVYGKQPINMKHIPEEYNGAPDPLDSASAYGQGKRLAEHLCILYSQQNDFEVKIARCFAFVGPYLPLDIHFAIGNFIRDAMNGGPIVIKGDGTPRRSYLYASDLAIWLWTILLKESPEIVFNVGSEESVSIEEVARVVSQSVTPKVKVEIQRKSNFSSFEQYVPDTKRIRQDLGVLDSFSLYEKIQQTLVYIPKQQ